MRSNEELEETEQAGEYPSLTKSLNAIKRLRDMGAVRISVGHIAVDFPDSAPMSSSDEEAYDEPNSQLSGVSAIDKWAGLS